MIVFQIGRRCIFLSLVLVAFLVAAPAHASDQFTIFLRDLNGAPLPGAQVEAFEQVDNGIVNAPPGSGSASAAVSKGNSLTGLLTADADGRIDVTIKTTNPNNRAIVLVANRPNAGPTAVVPFIVDATAVVKGKVVDVNETHRLQIAVPLGTQPLPGSVYYPCVPQQTQYCWGPVYYATDTDAYCRHRHIGWLPGKH